MSRGSVLVALVVAGCTAGGETVQIKTADDEVEEAAPAVDEDGDGHEAGVDCDDADPAVHPGAAETCNGLDDDCDDQVDEDAVDASTWLADGDGDGFGDDAAATRACAAPADHVATGGDCDDADPAISPEAAEVCDGIDNDCDGATDDADDELSGPTLTVYRDADEDGYGDPAAPLERCAAGLGLVEDASDCDDGDAAVNPGAEEVCSDGVDNDCDGLATGCRFEGTVTIADADAGVRGTSPSKGFGNSVGGGGDFNGDGFGDLVVGAPNWNDDDSNFNREGALFVFLGPLSAGTFARDEDRADLTLFGKEPTGGSTAGDGLGASVAARQDLDGDGYDDVLTSCEGDAHGGTPRLHVLYGPLVRAPGLEPFPADRLTHYASLTDAWDGVRLAGSPGDLDGDGTAELLLTARGGESWIVSAPDDIGLGLADIVQTTFPASASDVALAGDLDGDGLSEMLVSDDDSRGSSGLYLAGEVHLLPGDTAPGRLSFASAATVSFEGTAAQDQLGAIANNRSSSGIAGLGDLDGDGLDDFGMAAPQRGDPDKPGAVYVFTHAPTPADTLADAELVVTGVATDELSALAGEVDLDQGGRPELMVMGKAGRGRIYGFYGEDLPATGTLVTTDDFAFRVKEGASPFTGDTEYLENDVVIVPLSDVNGDGLGDFATANSTAGRGEVYLFFGQGL